MNRSVSAVADRPDRGPATPGALSWRPALRRLRPRDTRWPRAGRLRDGRYRAYSTERDSRITVTLI